jgi:hypothetical protein
MIIETLTAFRAVKFVWETLEILHLLRVGHETGKDTYELGICLIDVMQGQLQKRQDKKNPMRQIVQGAQTSYDFQASGEASRDSFHKKAQKYFDVLSKSLMLLNDAKGYFLETHLILEKMVMALNSKDEQLFLFALKKFTNSFISFNDKFKQFSLLIEPPPRQQLYLAEIAKKTKVIEKFNAYVGSFTQVFKELQETNEKIAELFKNDFHIVPTPLVEGSSSPAPSFAQLERQIRECMDKPERIPETMQTLFAKNKELAVICTAIAQGSTPFKQSGNTAHKQTDSWTDDPRWLPLLTETEQIEAGQRIFLHAMNETEYLEKEKLRLAKIFLRQYVSGQELKKESIDLLSQELANLLILKQIEKCKTLMQFLKNYAEGGAQEDDPDGLLDWLATTRSFQNSVELFKKVLVLPYCLSQYHIEALRPKLENLLPNENVDALIEAYRASYWGAIREKSDQLIQLPPSFKTKIIPNDRFQTEELANDANVVSPVLSELAQALILDLEALKAELHEKKSGLDSNVVYLRKKVKDAREEKENREHTNGVIRIKKSHRYLGSIDLSSNNLNAYLYRPEIINEVDRKRRVPTVHDLERVIYSGVDLHGIYLCKDDAKPKLLVDYFYPTHQKDSKMQAFFYALRKCQVNALPLLRLFSYPAEQLLAIGNGEATTPSLVIILKNTKKISIPANSLALNNISPKTKEETETFINQLNDYSNLAWMRFNSNLRNELPLKEKFKLLVQSLFKFGHETREERFTSVHIIMGGIRAVFSAEDIKAINQALKDLKKSYEGRCEIAKKTSRSTLYTLLKKAMDGCIAVIHEQLSDADQKQLQLEEENTQYKEKVKTLEATLEKETQDKCGLEAQLKESEASRERDKAEMEAQLKESEASRKQDKAEMEAQLKESEAKIAQDKAEMEAQLKESEAKIAQDKAEMEAQLKESEAKIAQDKKKMEAQLEEMKTQLQESQEKIKNLEEFMMNYIEMREPTPTPASEVQTPECSNSLFFKP